MTPDELHDLILTFPDCVALAKAGNDQGCADLLTKLAPPVTTQKFVTDRDMFSLLAPDVALEAVQTLSAQAQGGDPIVALIVKWLSPSEGGVDCGNQAMRDIFDAHLKGPAATALKACAEVPLSVTANEVSAAWARYRPQGKIDPSLGPK